MLTRVEEVVEYPRAQGRGEKIEEGFNEHLLSLSIATFKQFDKLIPR